MKKSPLFTTLLFCLLSALPAQVQARDTAPETAGVRTASAAKAQAKHYSGTVTAVSDGDTLRLTDTHGRKHKIRLAYIDAPELQQAHGQTARRALEKAVLAQTVDIIVFDEDRYGREVAQVWANGQDVNLMQIEHGHAWHYASIAQKRQYRPDYEAYRNSETAACNRRNGLWQNHRAQAPWQFRKAEREKNGLLPLWN